MLKFFRLPFGISGDRTPVPDAVDVNGNVSYAQGYGFDYERQKTDPAHKNIERDKNNQLYFDITNAIAELQAQGVPDFITAALNGGSAYSYGQFAIVRYSGDLYISLAAANTATPADATKWALLPNPARIQEAYYFSAVAGGTVDALTVTLAPAVAAYPAAPGTLIFWARIAGANTSTTPTVAVSGLAAKTIVKGSNQALVAGDLPGAGAWALFAYDAALDKMVLLNPAYPAGTVTTANDATFADNSIKAASTGWVRGAMSAIAAAAGFAASLTTNGYIKFPSWLGGWVVQWMLVTANSVASGKTLNAISGASWPTSFPTSCLMVMANITGLNIPVGNHATTDGVTSTASAASTNIYSSAAQPSISVTFLGIGK